MSLCIVTGAKTTVLATQAFTLMWMHSVEKVEWQEDWRMTPAGLEILEARIKGSGAGMEPPDDSVLQGEWWVYHPRLDPLPEIVLARSGVGQWQICFKTECESIEESSTDMSPAVLQPCPAE